jgi:HAD superfamily hydrolase (TIGR01450 family)
MILSLSGASSSDSREHRVVLCDIDGVVWLARQELPRASEAVALLRSEGYRVVFVTNNSFATREEQESHLDLIGIPAAGDVVTSAMAAASLVEPESRVLVCGGPGLLEAIREREAHPVSMVEYDENREGIDAVVVGFHRTFDYEGLRRAHEAIRHGARFIASNTDSTYPTPDGPIPGGGSIVAAVTTASGVTPQVAGKPHRTMATLVRSTVTGVDSSTVMIGDRLSTDGRFARELGCRFGLVRSEVSADEIAAGRAEACDFDGTSLWSVAQQVLESS